MKAANDNLPLALRRSEAAQLCAISVSTFDSWVKRGTLPGPLPGTRRWSRAAIERAVNEGIIGAPVTASALSPFEEWKRANAR